MLGSWTYLIWLLVFISVPLVILLRWRNALWRQRRALGWATVGAWAGGWAWDAFAVRVGLWFYEPAHIVGVWFLGLPLEEWLWITGVTWMFGGLTVILAERATTAKAR